MKNLSVISLFFLAQSLIVETTLAYSAYKSTEAIVEFNAELQTSFKRPSESTLLENIEDQLMYLFGPLLGHTENNRLLAAPKGDHEITILDTLHNETGALVQYKYRGTFVIANGRLSQFRLLLPRRIDHIEDLLEEAEKFNRNKQRTSIVACTDEHYISIEDFWYFWDPDRKNCPFRTHADFSEFLLEIRPEFVQRIPNTQRSYPEYHRLADENGVIHISILYGMDDSEGIYNPFRSDDIAAENFVATRDHLINEYGFTAENPWARNQIERYVKADISRLPHVEELTREYNGNRAQKVVVRMFFGPSGFDENSAAFHYFLEKAVEESSIFIYDGHSGLGGNLDINRITDVRNYELSRLDRRKRVHFKPSPDKYQIYFFNSCSSYTYYNSMFFNLKKTPTDIHGTKSLDILTAAIETPFDNSLQSVASLVGATHIWAQSGQWTSYQSLAKNLFLENLLGVNGDEDNPTEPVR